MSVAPSFILATGASGSTGCSHSLLDSFFGLRLRSKSINSSRVGDCSPEGVDVRIVVSRWLV